MKRVLLLVTPAFLACGLNAAHLSGHVSVVGSASVEASPEYAEFSIFVESKCFPLGSINEAHDQFVAELQTKFNGYFKVAMKGFNSVEVSPGSFGAYSHTIYNRTTSENETVCQNTYRKTSTITIKTSDWGNISSWITSIYKDVGSVLVNAAGDERSPSTITNVSGPDYKICDSTRKELRKNALRLARENAEEEFRAEFCGTDMVFDQVCFANATNPGSAVRYRESYAKSAAFAPAGESASPEYTAGKITIEASREYIFNHGPCHLSCQTGSPQSTGSSQNTDEPRPVR